MKVTKKLLSVLLAVIMIMTSMSVCFGTLAAGGTPTTAQWNDLLAALSYDSVKNADFSTVNGKYTVDDPDGKVLEAVEAYWDVFSTLANKNPATGNPDSTSNSTGSNEGNRVIQEVNESIRTKLATMSGYEAAMGTFVQKLINNKSVTAGTGSTQTVGGSTSTTNDKTVPHSNLSAVDPISITVVSSGAVTGYTLDNLPENVTVEKTFTVEHANDRYNYTYTQGTTQQGSGCNATTVTTYTRTYAYFYYISGTTVTPGSSVSTQAIKNAASILSTYADYFTADLKTLVNAGSTTINSVKTAVNNAKSNVTTAFSGTVWSHFFSTYDVDALSAKIDLANEIIRVGTVAVDLTEKVEAGYADIITNEEELGNLYHKLTEGLATYDAASQAAKDYIVAEGFDRASVAAFANAVLREIELIELRALKQTIADTIVPYLGYKEDNVADRTVSETELNVAKGTVDGFITSLNSYADANVAEVWEGEDIDGLLAALSENLEYLITVNGYTDAFANRYAYYVSTVYSNTNIADDSADLLAAVQSYDSWYTGLNALIAEIEAELGEEVADKIFTELDTEMKAHMDSRYNALHARVLAQIDIATELYNLLKEDDLKVSVVNINTFAKLEKALGGIERDVYEFLLASANFAMPAETKAKYDALASVIFDDYYAFLENGGFNKYDQTEIADIVRPESEYDDAREGDYTVTDEKVEKVIDLIDSILNDEEIKALLGNLINKDEETGEPTGEPFDLAALLGGVIDGLFTDDLLNTIMGFLYPAVTKEFAKVWAGLPPTITVEDVDTGILGMKADVTANLSLYTVEKATHSIGMSIFPIELAEKLRAEYPAYEAVAAVLDDVKTAASYQLNGDGDDDDTYNGDPWKDTALFKNVVDENGNPVLNEDGTNKTALNFNWGIDEAENKREAFIDAAVAALSGLEPLLLALLSNQYYEKTNKIGTGSGSASVIGIPLNLNVDPIDLVFMVSNNPGYNNVIAPVLELLGMVAPDGNTLTSTRKVLEDGLFGPIDALINKIAANPVDTILSILPNVMYAISADRILPLLDMLKINIEYTTNATYSVIGIVNGSMNDVYKSEEPIKINVKDMINLEDMGLDLSFPGIWSMISGMLGEGVTLPELDAGTLATLGKLTWKDTKRSEWTYTPLQSGKAAYIEANTADVLIFLVKYLLNTLAEQPTLIEDILAATAKEGEEPAALPEIVTEIIASATANPDNTIAVVVELLNAVEYDTLKEYVWYVSELNEDTVVGLTPAIQQYLAYDNDWTKATATYLVENVDEIIGAVMGMVNGEAAEGEEAEAFSISAELTKLIGGLFTNKNITALAKVLGGLDLNALLAGDEEATEDAEIETADESEEAPAEEALDINELVKNFTGIDLSVYAQYADLAEDAVLDWGFEDGDKAGFVNALVELLEPLSPVLDFILAGKDLTLLDEVTLIGYNGYDSAIIPLLEALGATPAALAEGDNALEVTLNALLARVDAIVADPVDEILNLIPGVLYFIKSNGLTTAVRNLLQPVLVILETINPIYALNLNQIIGDLTKDLGFSISLDNLSFEAIFDILPAVVDLDLSGLEEIIDDVCEVITPVTYTSASSLIGENGKKGAYGQYFDAADLVTVIVSYLLDWIQTGDNANAVAALIAGDDAAKAEEMKAYISGAVKIIGGIDFDYEKIDWAYNFPEGFDEAIFESGISIQPTIELVKNSIGYPNNWTEETAKYVAENLDLIVDEVIGLIDENYASLADLIADKVTIYSAENVDAIVKVVADILAGIDETLVNTVGVVLDVDLTALQTYKAPEIKNGDDFAAALADVLATIQPVVDWLLFGKDYAFFSKSGADLVTIKGTEGYAYGLAPILEALGVELPAADKTTVESVLKAVFARVDAILANPVDEVLELLPNIIYFLNANGVSVSVKNLLAGINALMAELKASFGVEVDLMSIFNDAINGLLPEESTVTLDVANLDLESIFALAQELIGLDLTAIANILVDFCVGQIVAYKSVSGEYGFKMLYTDEFAKYDMVTVLVTALLLVVKTEGNAEAIDELIGKEGMVDAILGIFEGGAVEYTSPDWKYYETVTGNGTTEIIDYAITYPNNWTEETAKYVAENIGEIGDMVAGLIDSNYDSLGALINSKVKIYTGENIQAIVDAITGLLENVGDNLLEAAGLLLGADLNGLKAYKAPEGEMTAKEFAEELAYVLTTYAEGVVEWLLLGQNYEFFVDEDANADGVYDEDIITINGAHGYAEGLALLLEAIGCENLPDAYAEGAETADIISGVLTSLFTRVEEILADPVDEVVELLPNILYFLNANGVAAVIDNTLSAVYALLTKLEALDVKVDINELVNIPELLGIEEEVSISLDNLTIAAILEVVSVMTGLDITAFEDVLVGFYLGEVNEYDSVSTYSSQTYKMSYKDDFDKHDMITVIATLAILTIKDEANAEVIKELAGEEIYQVILNVLNMEELQAEIKDINWILTDKVGESFSAIETSELQEDFVYGPLYTVEMEQYIIDNFGEFVDDILYLLGLNINGVSVESLNELLNELLNGSVYNSTNVIAIRDALVGVIANIDNIDGAEHIKAILKSSLGVDLGAVATVEIPEFENDRAQFTASICDVLEPIYPVLKWLLANEDLAFFVDEAEGDAITLKGGEGYAYGIIPLLEVLGCENIVTAEDYYAAVEADGDVLITSILTPLLDRVDVIVANPAEEILGILPNLIYFINSNGVDTVVKNTLNAVYTLLNAIEPVAKIDIYELIGIDLSTLTFEKLFEMLLDMIEEATGYSLESFKADAVAELTVGTLESYTSANGETAYRMVYETEGVEGEVVTVVLRLLVLFIAHENNQEALVGILRDNLGMSAETGEYVSAFLKFLCDCITNTQLGMDTALATIYYIFYGVDTGVGETADGLKDVNEQWKQLLIDLGRSEDPYEASIGNLIAEILGGELFGDIFEDVIDPDEGIAPNGLIAFFQKIISWFKTIIEWFKGLFA